MNARQRSRTTFVLALLGLGACDGQTDTSQCQAMASAQDVAQFHGSERNGAFRHGPRAEEVERRGLTLRWESEPLDPLMVDGLPVPPLIYASPLLLRDVALETRSFRGTTDVVFAATSTGWVYAIDAGCDPGTILWRNRISNAVPIERLDQGVPLGVLSTPVLDPARDRIYVAGHDAEGGWQLHALALSDGRELVGWPVNIDDVSLSRVNTNGPARFHDASTMSQRGALALSPHGRRVYVPFGTYWGSGVGWMVSIDTNRARVAAAFSSAPSLVEVSSGGIWGSAGPTVDADGHVWVTTGNSPPGTGSAPDVWGNSLLELDADLVLQRAYSPFDYCLLDAHNMDLGASQPLLLSGPPGHAESSLLAFGGKQGVVYLLDKLEVPVAGAARRTCDDDASTDQSLLPPAAQPQYGRRGPLSVFGPYSRTHGEIDHAKMRTKLAEWSNEGRQFIFASGTSKAAPESTTNVAPSIAKLEVVFGEDNPYLEIAATNDDVVMHNPGSPIVTGTGPDAIVWILDRAAPRTAPLLDPATPRPRLYAFAAEDLRLLSSTETNGAAGKYSSPTPAGDILVVATDRIEAWGP